MTKPLIGIGTDIFLAADDDPRDRAFTFLTYVESLKRAGAMPVLLPPQPENAAELLAGLDGLLLAGGPDCDPRAYGEEPLACVEPMDARRQSNDLALARAAREQHVPTLGICLGMQVMAVAAGGSLVQDIDTQIGSTIDHVSLPAHRTVHPVTIHGGTRLGALLGEQELEVNSSHHQSVRSAGRGLTITAQAPDGVVEGVEDAAHPFYVGVQWHPEDMSGTPSATRLFGALVAEARKRAEARRETGIEMSLSPAAAAE